MVSFKPSEQIGVVASVILIFLGGRGFTQALREGKSPVLNALIVLFAALTILFTLRAARRRAA